MINLQAVSSSAGSTESVWSRPRDRVSWPAHILAWWRRRGGDSLVLRRVDPRFCDVRVAAGARPSLGEIGAIIAAAARARPGGLMNAYVASAVDVALEAEALGDGMAARRVRTPVHDLVAEVADALQPCARLAGATLAYDRECQWSCVAVTDPGRLRKALTHLVLRAMSGSEPDALVRILVTAEPAAARIAVLTVRGGSDPGLFDLAALVRLVNAIGGALVVEAARAGCSPIAIVLPTRRPAAPAMACGSRQTLLRAEAGR